MTDQPQKPERADMTDLHLLEVAADGGSPGNCVVEKSVLNRAIAELRERRASEKRERELRRGEPYGN